MTVPRVEILELLFGDGVEEGEPAAVVGGDEAAWPDQIQDEELGRSKMRVSPVKRLKN